MKLNKTLIVISVAMSLIATSVLFPFGGVSKAKATATYGSAIAGDLLSGKTATVDAGQITGTLTLSGTAIAGNVLSGKTYYDTDAKTKQTGTMPNKVASGTVITPGVADQAIPQGYYGGMLTDGKVAGDADLIAGNILSGKSIFGVTGTLLSTGTQTFSGAAGTYSFTVPAGVTTVYVNLTSATGGGGGGAGSVGLDWNGAYYYKAAGSGGNGTAGGVTSFGALVSIPASNIGYGGGGGSNSGTTYNAGVGGAGYVAGGVGSTGVAGLGGAIGGANGGVGGTNTSGFSQYNTRLGGAGGGGHYPAVSTNYVKCAVTPGQVITVKVGAGGAGGAAGTAGIGGYGVGVVGNVGATGTNGSVVIDW